MVNNLNRYLQTAARSVLFGPADHIACRDGTVMSVQANPFTYCKPRNMVGPWTHVEVMMIDKTVQPIHFQVDVDGIGAYIPIECVAREILARGNAVLT